MISGLSFIDDFPSLPFQILTHFTLLILIKKYIICTEYAIYLRTQLNPVSKYTSLCIVLIQDDLIRNLYKQQFSWKPVLFAVPKQ